MRQLFYKTSFSYLLYHQKSYMAMETYVTADMKQRYMLIYLQLTELQKKERAIPKLRMHIST